MWSHSPLLHGPEESTLEEIAQEPHCAHAATGSADIKKMRGGALAMAPVVLAVASVMAPCKYGQVGVVLVALAMASWKPSLSQEVVAPRKSRYPANVSTRADNMSEVLLHSQNCRINMCLSRTCVLKKISP